MQKITKIFGSLLVLGALVLNTVAVVSAASSISISNPGFESNPAFVGWNAGSNWTADSSAKHGGSKAARVKGSTNSSSILKQSPLSTAGYNNIKVSFWYYAGESLESSDFVKAEYTTDGTTWSTFYTINDDNDYSGGSHDDDDDEDDHHNNNNSNSGWYQAVSSTLPGVANDNPNFGIRFVANLDSSSRDYVNIDDVSVTGDQIQYKVLSVSVVGDGSVSSSPAGISCGADCSESYVKDTVVSLTATPATGFEFTGWSGACSGTAACSVTMSNAKTVTANFDAIKTTISATKIVCNNESDLPNWGSGAADITATTANDYVASHANCHLEKDWNFEWALYSAGNPGDNSLSGGSSWNVFGPTNNSGIATTVVAGQEPLWVREQMKPGYVTFSGATSDLDSEVSKKSAEIYCQSDVLNYDNFDYINQPASSSTVYCVAFNALEKPVEIVKPVISFLGFRDQADGSYNPEMPINSCGAVNTTGAIAWEWKLDSGTAPMSYKYTITSGPTAIGYTATIPNTYYNGTIPMEGTYVVEVVGTDANSVESAPISCAVTYTKTPATVDQCPNIEGTQESVPEGKHKDNEGNCVQNEVVPVCSEKTMDVVSGTDDLSGSLPAVLQSYIHGAWNTSLGGNWIWNVLGVTSPTTDEEATFAKSFTIPGTPLSATLDVLADNSYSGFVNSFTSILGADAENFGSPDSYNIPVENLVNGSNNISFTVKNWAQEEGSAESNPAGLNYKLHVIYKECTTPEVPVNTAPVITLNTDTDVLYVGGAYTEAGAVVNDTEDNLVNFPVTSISGTVDTSIAGNYTITYTYTDTGGLTATITRTVTVNPAVVIIDEDPKTQCNDGIDNDGDNKIDFTGENADSGCSSSEDNDETNPVVVVPENPGNPGGVVPTAFLGGAPAPQGRVLGASTTCGIYLEKYLRKGYKNDEESVKKVQNFLNDYFKLNIPVTGFFGPQTDSGVKKFQTKFADEILKPWKLNSPTGIVYLTTTTKINKIMCPELDLQTPTLIPIDQNPEAPKL